MLAQDLLKHPTRDPVGDRRGRFSCHDPRGCELPPHRLEGYLGPSAFEEPGEAARS